MNKPLVGVGIGCGALVLIGVVGMVVAGMWAKSKVEGFADKGDAIAQQEKRVADLNAKFDFKAPQKGLPVSLTEERVQQYLAVRAALSPVFKQYEAKGKKFEKKDHNDVSIGDAVEAGGLLMDLMRELREKWLVELAARNMSPREFHAITAAIYTSSIGTAMGQVQQQSRAALEQMKAQVQKQVENPATPQEMRDAAKESLAQIDEQLAELPPAGAEPSAALKIHTANAQLLEKYKKQIEDDANMGLDLLLPGYSDEEAGLGEALDNIDMGGEEEAE